MNRILLFLFVTLLLQPLASFAQSHDSIAPAPQVQRPLPPSILMELRRSEHNRTLVFHDTVHASDIERAHASDTGTGATNYADSAITLFDTAVSISHKEWLDSELVEIPELQRFGNRVHFNYSPAIMTESEMTQVPFDSTILARMNPVTREVLPYFDQSPIPMPLALPKLREGFLEASAGNVIQPSVKAFFDQAFSPRVSGAANAEYESQPSLPLHSLFDIAGILHASLGSDPALEPFHSSELSALLGYTSRGLSLRDSSNASSDHTMSLFHAGAWLGGDATEALHYSAKLDDREWSEDIVGSKLSESLQDLSGSFSTKIVNGFTLSADASYSHALSNDTSNDAERITLRLGTMQSELLSWDAGAAVLGGSGAIHEILPVAHIRLALNPRWQIGASFDPHAQLSSMVSLTATDPFYSSTLGRGGSVDKINLQGFMSYALSADDALRLEANFITRDHEPVFLTHTLPDSATIVTAIPAATQRLSFTASGNFLLFAHDVLTGALTITSARNLDSSNAMPFEPTMTFEAAYRWNSLSEIVRPMIRFRSIALPSRTLGMIDIEADVHVWQSVGVKVALDNVLNGASDFWPGYPESPRSIFVSLRYGL